MPRVVKRKVLRAPSVDLDGALRLNSAAGGHVEGFHGGAARRLVSARRGSKAASGRAGRCASGAIRVN